jgi:predicted TIM-barrel fold metal-dependent hydrolase
VIITDSGLHIWQAPTPERPWNPAKAHLKDPMDYEDLRRRMAEAGVHRAILVPPSFAGGRNEYSLEAAARYPHQFAVMASIPLDKPEGREILKGLTGQVGFVGVRLTFHHEHDETWIRDGTADWFWPVAERMGIPVMMNCPTVLKDVGDVARRFPSLRLIIDHMGRRKGMKDGKLGAGLQETIALANLPNVYVKLTSTQSCSTDPYPYLNIHEYLRRLIEAYGPARCFWGTDLSAMLSRTDCTYRQAVTMFTDEMPFLSQSDIEWIMGRGLAECLPWPVHPNVLGE